MTESTNYILFAIVIMLFAMVLELISTGLFGKAIAEVMAESLNQR